MISGSHSIIPAPGTWPVQLIGPNVLIRRLSRPLMIGERLRYSLNRFEKLGFRRFRSLLAERKSFPS